MLNAACDSQRMSELRLRALERLNSLAAEFLHNYLKDPNFRPDDQVFRSLMVLTSDITILFSQQAFACFKELEVMIGQNLRPTGKGNVDAFINAADAALRALYAEAMRAVLRRSTASTSSAVVLIGAWRS
jgi:hypothetical protein